MAKFKDITGQRFGRLTAIRETIKIDGRRERVWEFLCDCGKSCNIMATRVKRGYTKSCGCLKVDVGREIGKNNIGSKNPNYKNGLSHDRAWQRNMRLKKDFGIDEDEFEKLTRNQIGVCAICEKPPEFGNKLCVDHDHITGEIRGLLCNKCNTGLGLLKDDSEILYAAINYLKKSEQQQEEYFGRWDGLIG